MYWTVKGGAECTLYFEKPKLNKRKTKKIGQVRYPIIFFCGRIATEQKLAHPQAADGLQAKIEVVNEHQPLVTQPASTGI